MSSIEVSSTACAPSSRAKALNGAGFLAFRQGDYSSARPLFEQALAIAGEAPSAHFHFEECPFLSEPNAPRLLGDQSSCEPDRKPSPPVGPALTGRFSGKVGWDGKKISTSWKKSGALWQPATANAFQMEESIY